MVGGETEGIAFLPVVVASGFVILLAHLVGRMAWVVGQPPVIGQIVAGIVLGPSLFGWLTPEFHRVIFDPGAVQLLAGLAEIGITVYMFHVGLKLDAGIVRSSFLLLVAISAGGTLVPMTFGVALGLYLHPRYVPPDVPIGLFALFIGVAMSITAFPVLARIVEERGWQTDPGGHDRRSISCRDK